MSWNRPPETNAPRYTGFNINPPGSASGDYVTTAINGIASATIAGVANRLEYIPFRTDRDLIVDELALEVTAGVASSLARVGIYDSTPSGRPNLLRAGTTDMDCATTGAKAVGISAFTFQAGVTYWIGVLFNSTQTVRGIPLSACLSLGIAATGGTHNTVRRATQTYASGLPASAPVTTAASAIVPLVRMRIA